MAGRFYYYNNKSEVTRTSLYTDRSIYRPGQTVHVAAMMYKYDNRNYTGGVLDGQNLTLSRSATPTIRKWQHVRLPQTNMVWLQPTSFCHRAD